MKKTRQEESPDMTKPRVVPLPLRMKIITGTAMQLVLGVAAVLLYFIWLFGYSGDFTRALVLQYSPTNSVQGRLLPDCANSTHEGKSDSNVHRHTFQYVVNGHTFYGRGYSLANEESSREVTVHYSPRFPACSQVAGMRPMWDLSPMWTLGITLAVTLLPGVVMVFQRRRTIRTLRTGQLTTACITKREEYSDVDGPGEYVRYDFSFKANDGKRYTVRVYENKVYSKPLEDEAVEPLVYDPEHPKTAYVLDSLPGRPRVDESGVFRDSRPITTPFLMITPACALVMLCLCLRSAIQLLT